MGRRFSIAFILMAGMGMAAAGEARIGDFSFDESGALGVDGLRFALSHYRMDWKSVRQRADRTKPDAGFPKTDGDAYEYRGTFAAADDENRFSVRISAKADGGHGLLHTVALDHDTGIASQSVCLTVDLPVERFLGKTVALDGKPHSFGNRFDAAKAAFHRQQVKRIVLPAANGTLTLSGPGMSVSLIDARKFGMKSWLLRIGLNPSRGDIRHAELSLSFRFLPAASTPLAFGRIGNRAFADEVAGDGRGGWTDQGPANDLRAFPPGRKNLLGIDFDIADGPRAAVVLRGAAAAELPSAADLELDPPASGRFLYLLHATGWGSPPGTKIGTVSVESARGDELVEREVLAYDVVEGVDAANFWNPSALKNGAVAWRGQNPNAAIGLYLTRIPLSGKPVRRIAFASAGNSVWLIAGATLSDREADAAPEGRKVVIAADGKEWFALPPRKAVLPGSALDFSGRLDAPAGKYGFVRAAGENFEFADRPGIPVRFYGANICFDAHFMPDRDLDRMVDDFAASGYNLMRFHHFDRELADTAGGSSLNLIEERLDRLDYLLNACREKGVYVTLDLFTIRKIAPGELLPDRSPTAPEYKALLFVEPKAMENLKEFARRLMTRVNRYSGLAWNDDPAIAFVNLVNEDNIAQTVESGGAYVRGRYEKRFAEHVAASGVALTDTNRTAEWRRFLSSLYRERFRELRAFAAELKLRMPLSDQNSGNHITTVKMRDQYDYVDTHQYWGHPAYLGPVKFKPPVMIGATSAVEAFAGCVNNIAGPRILGKPFAVTEWNYVAPNPHAAEGAFLMGACAAAQNWSALARFAYSHAAYRITRPESQIIHFDIVNDPVRMLSERAGSLFFLRGDVKPSTAAHVFALPEEYMNNNRNDWYPSMAGRLLLLGRTGTMLVPEGRVPDWPAGTEAVIRFPGGKPPAGKARHLTVDDFTEALRLDRSAFTNDTGQITLDAKAGTFLVKTERSEGFVVPGGRRLGGDFAEVDNGAVFGAVLVASLDDLPLTRSDRMLLLHLTDVKNSGQTFRDDTLAIVEDWGKAPNLARRGTAEIALRRDLAGFTVTALDMAGAKISEIPVTRRNGHATFTVDTIRGDKIVMAYEISR